MIKVPLTRGKVALVDAQDRWVLNYKWCALKGRKTWYAVRHDSATRGHIRMHRAILGFPAGEVDHENCNGLDNQRHNLRVATRAENGVNAPPPITNTSGFKGVSRHRNKWIAYISYGDKTYYLGLYIYPEAAAIAYGLAAIILFKEFARQDVANTT